MVKRTVKNLKHVTHKSDWKLQVEKDVAKRAGTSRRRVALRWANGKSAFTNKEK